MGVYDITGYTQMIESWKKLRSATEDYAISLSELKKNSYTIGFNGLNPIMICSDKEIKQLTKRYMETKINENIRRNAEMDDFWKEILKERDRLAERCKYLENACNNLSYRAFLRHIRMPDITDYTYDPDTATTTITWSDNTTTTVTAEDPATADQYTGFMIAYAKKAAGNTSRIQSIYERVIKLPEKKALAKQKAKEREEEQKKIRENQKARKRRQRVRCEARRRKEEYEKSLIREEAKRLAEKEYGVPYDKNDWLNTGEDKGHETT